MATTKQTEANRMNAQKSTGPRTSAGKATSRFNALKHGIYAVHQVMFDEKAEDLAELAAEYHNTTTPPTPNSASSSTRWFITNGASAACAASKPTFGIAPTTPSS
jgi:hypothetical protein